MASLKYVKFEELLAWAAVVTCRNTGEVKTKIPSLHETKYSNFQSRFAGGEMGGDVQSKVKTR